MKKPGSILIAVDLLEPALGALDAGILLGAQLGAKLVLLSVIEPYYYSEAAYTVHDMDFERSEVRLRKIFGQRAARWAKEAPFPTEGLEVRVRQGMVVNEILNAAREEHADFIVMGTHGRSGISRAVLGSVTEQVIRRAPCPVLAVREALGVDSGIGAGAASAV